MWLSTLPRRYLKHELECEQHLRHEALRSLEQERQLGREVKRTLLKDYEAKCLSLMRNLQVGDNEPGTKARFALSPLSPLPPSLSFFR